MLELDGWEAYCVDEAAAVHLGRIESGEKPPALKDAEHKSSVRAALDRIRKRKQ